MLPLIKVTDSVDLVCSEDPSVKLKRKDSQGVIWALKSATKTDGKETVVTARALSSSELLRCQGFLGGDDSGTASLTVGAARMGTIKVKQPGETFEDSESVVAVLDRFSPAALAALGGFILARSLETDDPIEATG